VKRLAILAAACACAGVAVGACGDDGEDEASTTTTGTSSAACPTQGATVNRAYASEFEGEVMMDDKKHVLVVTRDGKPVAGASVCVNTAMVGMRSMHYSAGAKDLGDGRYEVPMKFEMQGTYTGNVVTKAGADDVLVPLTVKVGAGATSDDDSMSTTTTGAMEDDDSMSTTTTDDDEMTTKTTSGAMDDEDDK